MNVDDSIYVAGHRGMVGSAVVRRLGREGFTNIITRTRAELDLRDQAAVSGFFDRNRPRHVVLAAARVGGILANDTWPARFLYDNLMIAANVIHAAHAARVERLLFLASTCIYPRLASQPLSEEALLTGPLEPTNEAYAVAKIAGIELCQAYRREHGCRFISALPTNLYGPGDSFDLETSHVVPALMRRFHEAKASAASAVEVWGSGTPRRELLHVDDCAEALLLLMRRYDEAAPINVGLGEDISIAELAKLVAAVVGYEGEIRYDRSKPDGAPRKLVDCRRIHALGWRARTPLREGLERTYGWFLEQLSGRGVRGMSDRRI